MARELTPLAREPGPLPGAAVIPGLEDIPDPAAQLARRPAPEPALPAEPSPTRPERARRTTVALAVAVTWIAGSVVLLGLRRDIAAPAVALPLALLLLITGAALLLAVRPRARGLPAGVRLVQALPLLLALAFAALALLGARPGEPLPDNHVLPCLALAAEMAVVPLALAALTLRGSFLTAPAWRGAAIGAMVGLGSAIGMHAHCRYAAPIHILLAHGLPIVGGALLGALLGALRGRA